MTGDVSPDAALLRHADVIVTTPEKWDGVSRSWRHRNYVQQIALIVIDEIHMVGEDRGPVLEVSSFLVSFSSFRPNESFIGKILFILAHPNLGIYSFYIFESGVILEPFLPLLHSNGIT